MDRRFVWAIVLMMIIAVLPSFFVKPAKQREPQGGAVADTAGPAAPVPLVERSLDSLQVAPPAGPAVQVPAETVTVSGPLYMYSLSTRGGAIVQAELKDYKSLFPADGGRPARLVADGDRLHQLGVTVGADTVWFTDWDFRPSARRLDAIGGEPLVLTAARGQVTVELRYRFAPEDYRIRVSGRIGGLGPAGGHLVVALGEGLRQTEADTLGNYYDFALVTKVEKSEQTRFSSLDRDATTTFEGPFEWVAVKSKYFAAVMLTLESEGLRLSGATARPLNADKRRTRAAVRLGLPVPAAGGFDYELYLGPMEHPRLARIGHDLDDINPYGWAIVRPLIRPVAIVGRWLLVWMHENLSLSYGICLIVFGVMIRVVLWPLNQKGMRASIRMQALQPEMQALQERYKNDPQQMQRNLMELYKKHGVNPFSGCWPVLLPWPILIALFVVFQYSIELRGQSFLWLPDLSQKDPIYILPILMGISMYAVNKVGMAGVPPTPQTKMMLYFLPIMMTVLFVSFASGLNLYYTVQNIVSVPQQWYLAKERLKRQPPPPPPPAPRKK